MKSGMKNTKKVRHVKTYSLEFMINKHIGKAGTKNREEFEKKLFSELRVNGG